MLTLVWVKNELFDKEVNAQKESLKKYFQGSRKLMQAHEKVCNENNRNKKRHARKMLLVEGGSL